MSDADMPRLFALAVAGDLEILATLHDVELTSETLARLHARNFPTGLALRLDDREGRLAISALSSMLSGLGDHLSPEDEDELAAGYADVYLLNALECAPYASPWLDQDGLMRQQPMLDIAAFYGRHGLKVENRSARADDHLALMLRFLAHLLENGRAEDSLTETARFLRVHLIPWLPRFANTLAQRRGPPFYVALAKLTAAFAERLRTLLAPWDDGGGEIKAACVSCG